MTISRVGSSAFSATQASTTLTVTIPTHAAGDYILIVVGNGEDSPQPSITGTTGGFTAYGALGFLDYGPGGISTHVYAKLAASASETFSITWNTGNSNGGGLWALAVVYRSTVGWHSTDPISLNVASGVSSTALSFPQPPEEPVGEITLADPDTFVVHFFQTSDDNICTLNTANGWSTPEGGQTTTGSDGSLYVTEQLFTTSGIKATPVWALSAGPDQYSWRFFELRESGPQTGSTTDGAGAGFDPTATGTYGEAHAQGAGASDTQSAAAVLLVTHDASLGASDSQAATRALPAAHEAGLGAAHAEQAPVTFAVGYDAALGSAGDFAGTVVGGSTVSIRVSWILLDLDAQQDLTGAARASAGASAVFDAYAAVLAAKAAGAGLSGDAEALLASARDLSADAGLGHAVSVSAVSSSDAVGSLGASQSASSVSVYAETHDARHGVSGVSSATLASVASVDFGVGHSQSSSVLCVWDTAADFSVGSALHLALLGQYVGHLSASVGLSDQSDGDTDATASHRPSAGAGFRADGLAEQWTYETHPAGAGDSIAAALVSQRSLEQASGLGAAVSASGAAPVWTDVSLGAFSSHSATALLPAAHDRAAGAGFSSVSSAVLHASVLESLGQRFTPETGQWVTGYAEFSLGLRHSASATLLAVSSLDVASGGGAESSASSVLSSALSASQGLGHAAASASLYTASAPASLGAAFYSDVETDSAAFVSFRVGSSASSQAILVSSAQLLERAGIGGYAYSYALSQVSLAAALGASSDHAADRLLLGNLVLGQGAGFSSEYVLDAASLFASRAGASSLFGGQATMLQASPHAAGLSQSGAGHVLAQRQDAPSGGLGISVSASVVRAADVSFGIGVSAGKAASGIYAGDLLARAGISDYPYAGGNLFNAELSESIGVRSAEDEFEEEMNRVLRVGADGRALVIGADDRRLAVGRDDRTLVSGTDWR